MLVLSSAFSLLVVAGGICLVLLKVLKSNYEDPSDESYGHHYDYFYADGNYSNHDTTGMFTT